MFRQPGEVSGTLLGARGIACSDADRARLSSCTDVGTLQRWLLKATTAGVADEVFSI
jgi:hypothetical protein